MFRQDFEKKFVKLGCSFDRVGYLSGLSLVDGIRYWLGYRDLPFVLQKLPFGDALPPWYPSPVGFMIAGAEAGCVQSEYSPTSVAIPYTWERSDAKQGELHKPRKAR